MRIVRSLTAIVNYTNVKFASNFRDEGARVKDKEISALFYELLRELN